MAVWLNHTVGRFSTSFECVRGGGQDTDFSLHSSTNIFFSDWEATYVCHDQLVRDCISMYICVLHKLVYKDLNLS